MNSELAALQEKLEESMQKKEKIDQFLINSRGIFRQQVRAEEGEVPGIQIVRRRQKKERGKKRAYCTYYARHIAFFFSLARFFACNPFSEHLERSTILFLFKPLNPNTKIQLLILCPYMFSMEVLERIC